MPVIFIDSSGVVKRYVQETGSAWVSGLFITSPASEVYVAAITRVEVVVALTRRVRGGTISAADAAHSCHIFLSDFSADYEVVAVKEALLTEAVRLAQFYILRGYDAVQLAGANQVNNLSLAAGAAPLLFVSADTELNAAARSEGLIVDNPNAHP